MNNKIDFSSDLKITFHFPFIDHATKMKTLGEYKSTTGKSYENISASKVEDVMEATRQLDAHVQWGSGGSGGTVSINASLSGDTLIRESDGIWINFTAQVPDERRKDNGRKTVFWIPFTELCV